MTANKRTLLDQVKQTPRLQSYRNQFPPVSLYLQIVLWDVCQRQALFS